MYTETRTPVIRAPERQSARTSVRDFRELEFNHFVVAKAEGIIFASARRNGKVENFLIDTEGKWVKQQVRGYFEYLPSELANSIRIKANLAYGKVPIYRVPTFNFS